MKLKEGFILREVAGTYLVVALGAEARKANVMITLNETGAFLWEKLTAGATEEELLVALLEEYDVPEDVAKADIKAFIKKVTDENLLD